MCESVREGDDLVCLRKRAKVIECRIAEIVGGCGRDLAGVKQGFVVARTEFQFHSLELAVIGVRAGWHHCELTRFTNETHQTVSSCNSIQVRCVAAARRHARKEACVINKVVHRCGL
ncbi:hypothetical protein PFISCL1PPCAC_12941 [Pristionchus fissidentatus]|uniref:Uncharacterized protein n=1 Tax=Pristionchus fissidentatus TaxID=1538716 RepID=A0AAV5VTD7_9BILA|nr:hypothetical protein PFISCL1PPCAC_12941 [Pristionchus fissidentatus]